MAKLIDEDSYRQNYFGVIIIINLILIGMANLIEICLILGIAYDWAIKYNHNDVILIFYVDEITI